MSHTPGPWRAEFPGPRSHAMSEIFASSRVDETESWRVAYVMREIDPSQRLIDDANASLIAAAPELLAVVRACRDVVYRDPNAPSNLAAMCDAAIAKAEGTS